MADIGHELTDEEIKKLEKKISKTYTDAIKKAEEHYQLYMDSFEENDKKHRQDVKNGTWTQEQYKTWRKNKILASKNYTDMIDVLTQDLHNADKISIQMARGGQIDIYALNANYAQYVAENEVHLDMSWSLYDHAVVEKMMRDDPDLLPPPSKKKQAEIDAKDIRWNREKLHSAFTSSILSGESIPDMAKSISRVAKMDKNAAVRNARTMATCAENTARLDTYKKQEKMGIHGKKQWVATLDERTRASHRAVNGEIVDYDKPFSNGLMCPGEQGARPEEVYNCRCTMKEIITDIEYHKIIYDPSGKYKRYHGTYSYDEWVKMHERIRRNTNG